MNLIICKNCSLLGEVKETIMIVDKVCDSCGEKFLVNTEDLPPFIETYLCPHCEEEIDRQMA